MKFSFTKMHSLGNHFIIINLIKQNINIIPTIIKRLSNHNIGIGFDQCLFINYGDSIEQDFIYRIFNKDGREVYQCINGICCITKFIYENKLTKKKIITISTKNSKIKSIVNKDKTVTAIIKNLKLGYNGEFFIHEIYKKNIIYNLMISNKLFIKIYIVNVGNPHAINIVKNVNNIPINYLGKKISNHKIFPDNINVGFVQFIDNRSFKIRVYERGCGETFSCGSAAIAAALISILYYKLENCVYAIFPLGKIKINWPNIYSPIYFTSKANFIYTGKYLGY